MITALQRCPQRFIHLVVATLFLPAIASAATPPLPAATGPYSVGSRILDLVDSDREENWTEKSDKRRIQVQLWYPAANSTGHPVPYIAEFRRLEPSLRSDWGEEASTQLNFIVPGTHGTAPIANKRFPLAILSHGMNAGRFGLTSLATDLASHGYVVAAIDHTFWGPGVTFRDGSIVKLEDGMTGRKDVDSNAIDRLMGEGIRVFSADQSFVTRHLLQLSKRKTFLQGRIDEARVAVVGHSMGGMAADITCLHDSLIKACVSLDGTLGNPAHVGWEPRCSSKPFMLIISEQFKSALGSD
jgi:dienelactone hydrolase